MSELVSSSQTSPNPHCTVLYIACCKAGPSTEKMTQRIHECVTSLGLCMGCAKIAVSMHKQVVPLRVYSVILFVRCVNCSRSLANRTQTLHATLRATEMARIATLHCMPLQGQNACKCQCSFSFHFVSFASVSACDSSFLAWLFRPLELHLTTSELWFGQEQEGILP